MKGPSGLVVKVPTQRVRDVGLGPTWFQFFSVKTGFKRKKIHLCISCNNMIITSGRTYEINNYVLGYLDTALNTSVIVNSYNQQVLCISVPFYVEICAKCRYNPVISCVLIYTIAIQYHAMASYI